MTVQNLKVFGYALAILGAILAVVGIFTLIQTYNYNDSLAATSSAAASALGGYGGDIAKGMKDAAEASYLAPVVELVLGAAGLFFGVNMLKKANAMETNR